MDRQKARPIRLLSALAAAVAAILALAACSNIAKSGSGSSGSSSGSAGSGSAGGSGKGVTLKAGVQSWSAAEIETDILGAIAKANPGLGVGQITTTTVEPATGWVGLQRGDIDFMTEADLPNQQSFATKTKAETQLVSKTYGGATQGWFVPAYAVAPGGPLHGLTSVGQLASSSWATKVGNTLYDDDPGWVTTQENSDRLKGFGMNLKHVTATDAALVAEVERAYKAKKPILFYYYHPSWLFAKYKLVQLKEPKPYTSKCFTSGGPKDCAIPTLSAWVAINKSLKQKAPKFVALLKKFRISMNDLQQLMEQNEFDGKSPTQLASQWVSSHKAEINQWVS